MDPPGITRHRRPFLAPLWLTLLAALVIGGVAVAFYRSAATTVVVLVPAVEKEPGTIDDPPLSPEGEQRAQQLARMFGDVDVAGGRVDAIYVSDDRRARQSAAPLAERLHRTPVVFSSRDARAAAARVLHEHPGGTALVIAGSATLAQMLQELEGADTVPGGQGASDSIYVVGVPSFGRAQVLRIRL